MSLTFRGKAQVEGVEMTFDVILHKTAQSRSLSHKFDLDVNQDEHGKDCAWKTRNAQIEGDVSMKAMSSAGNRAAVAAALAFLTPLAKVTISASENATWNGEWQYMPDAGVSENNSDVADVSFKLRRYVDSTQNTLAHTTPS